MSLIACGFLSECNWLRRSDVRPPLTLPYWRATPLEVVIGAYVISKEGMSLSALSSSLLRSRLTLLLYCTTLEQDLRTYR